MALMTPRQYGRLIFKVFFKGRSLLQEAEGWNRTQKAKQIIQANAYNFVIALLIVSLVEKILSFWGLQFALTDTVEVVAVVVATGIVLGIVVVEEGVALGVAGGVAGCFTQDFSWSFEDGLALGFALGVAFGAAFRVAPGLVKNMDLAKKNIGIPFGQIARRWLEIVLKENRQIEADTGRPLPNPFIVGRPIEADSEMFIGRKDIIDQIQREALREGGPGAILFIGNRRTGKTSTLLNLKRYLLSSLKPVFVDCQDPTISSSVTYFCRTNGKAIATTLGQTRFAAAECNSLAHLTEFLKGIQQDLQQTNQHLLICFDEYERLTEKIIGGDLADLPNTFRYWVQHLPRTICLFSGSHQLDEISQLDWMDYLINVRLVPISYLDFDSALRLVTAPITRFELQYEPSVEIAEWLVRRLGCQPFLLQATMSELVNHLNSLDRKVARQEDADTAIERMFLSWHTYFEHTWNKENNALEREVLVGIAKEKSIHHNSDKALRSLVRKEILRQEGGDYVFCVPVFKEWNMRNS